MQSKKPSGCENCFNVTVEMKLLIKMFQVPCMRKIVLKLSNEHECLFQLITCVQVLNQESYFKFTLLFKLTKVGEQFLDP